MITRITSTDKADKLIDELREVHGDLMFHQSGGCCDGSAPMCFPKGEFYLGNSDVEVGIVNNVPFYMSAEQFEYWEHTHLTLDAIKGTGGQFSLERPTGLRFIIRSRIYTDEEWDYLKEHPVKHCE
ncbi:MAG: DUF779 domain-containing protein [Betaproteobacteria bacterium]|jgi:hypothetical protein|nr:DUF779 domain-containing protein [Betaproteobacteria bacterium]|tara:strand:- start:84 stop:461 length:378 start_codon:yes stop_codon:yes gene_type:complete